MAVVGDLGLMGTKISPNKLIGKLEKRVFGVPVSSRQRFGFFHARNLDIGKSRTAIRAVMQVEKIQSSSGLKEGSLGFDVVSERELKEKGFLGLRKTKLVCTIGPACSSLDELEKLAIAGMNVARLNMCHNSREWHQDVIRKIKKLNKEKGYCVSVMIDTEGNQIQVDHGSSSSVKAEEHSIWYFTTEKFEGSRPFTIQANYEGFSEGVNPGDEIVIDGGMASFEVLEKVGNDLRCKCTDPGLLLPRAKLSFWRDGKLLGRDYDLPTLSTKDWSDVEFGISEDIDFIAVSFVKDADAIKRLRDYLTTKSSKVIKVLAKIESLESLRRLEEIIPSVQEDITYFCRQLNKPVIVASQLLESMVEYPTPTRAEVADVSEAVRQYADALMLSGESAIGSYGMKALSVLHTTSTRMEQSCREEDKKTLLHQRKLGVALPDQIAEQICNCAVEMADNLGVDAIFVYTKHGKMASLLSRNRPNPPIFAFTNDNSTRMSLHLQWGVTPLLTDLSDDMEANVKKTVELIKAKGMINKDDAILVVSDIIPISTPQTIFQSIQVMTIS
ncbi:unnamed protein product [Withania somnifera]